MSDALAVYGYASVVTSTPRSRAPRIIASASSARSPAVLFMWTMWSAAPVAAALAITSWKGGSAPPRTKSADDRRWMNTGASCPAAISNIRSSSRWLAPGV